MPWNPDVGYDAPQRSDGEADPLLAEFAVTQTAYSLSSDPDRRQPRHTTLPELFRMKWPRTGMAAEFSTPG